MSFTRFGALVASLLLASPAAAEVHLTINNGVVSLSAKDATVRDILLEWARVGRTKIVNGERVPGGPLTLQLTNVSEVEALGIILRSASGYLLAPRPVPTANASRFDRILIVPSSSGTRPATVVAALPPPPVNPQQMRRPGDESDDAADASPNMNQPFVPPGGRPPVFNTFPQPGQPTPPVLAPASAPPTAKPSPAAGVSVPGMVVPAPQPQPGPPASGPPDQP